MRRFPSIVATLAIGVLPAGLPADEPPAAAADAARFQQRVLEFARRDAQSAEVFARQSAERAHAAAVAAAPAEEAHARNKTAKDQADQSLAHIKESLQVAEQNKQAAEKALKDADAAVKRAHDLLEQARDVLRAAGQQLEATFLAHVDIALQAKRVTNGPNELAAATSAAAERVSLVRSAISDAGTAQQSAERAAEESRRAADTLRRRLSESASLVERLGEAKPKAEAAAAELQKRFTETEAVYNPLAATKAAAEKAAAEAKKQADDAASRVVALESAPPQADPKAIRLVKTFEHNQPVIACRFDPMGEYILAGCLDEALHRWDLITSSKVDMPGHKSWVRGFDMRADGDLLVSGSYAGRLVWWNPQEPSPQSKRMVDAHKGWIRGVALSPDGRFVATCGNDRLVKIWSAEDGAPVAELPGHDSDVYNVGFHPGGQRLVSGDHSGNLKEWEVGTWKHVRDLDASVLHKYDANFLVHYGGIRGMDFSTDGKYLVVCGVGQIRNAFNGGAVPTAVLFDCESGSKVAVMTPAERTQGTCWSVRFDPAGRFIVGAGGNNSGALWFWKPGEEKAFFSFRMRSVPYDVAFHPDGLRLVTGQFNKSLAIYDLGPKPKEIASTTK
jgi:WD40 repeat protein